MSPDEFVAKFPRLYHVADAQALPQILRHGLLSTEAALDLYEIPEPRRTALLSQKRLVIEDLRHDLHGEMKLRDQGPINEKKLAKCLTDLPLEEWYRTLNRRVFFWPSNDNAQNLLAAYPSSLLLTFFTAKIFEDFLPRIELSPYNSGSTQHRPPPRGSFTFRKFSDYDFAERIRVRGRSNCVAEVTLLGQLPNVEKYLAQRPAAA